MKSSVTYILLITLAIAGMLFVVLSEGEPVSVSKAESTLETKRFDPDNPPPDVSKTFHGVTKWKFECPCEVKYKTLEKVDDNGGCFVRVKVTGMKANLALPIVMWMPDSPPEGLKEHEDGHVQICQRVYAEADKIAEEIAATMIGKEYSGTGATVEDATKFASGIAVVDFSNEFESRVAKKAQNISEIYDYLARFTDSKQSTLVEEAFKTYERGKPRSISLNSLGNIN